MNWRRAICAEASCMATRSGLSLRVALPRMDRSHWRYFGEAILPRCRGGRRGFFRRGLGGDWGGAGGLGGGFGGVWCRGVFGWRRCLRGGIGGLRRRGCAVGGGGGVGGGVWGGRRCWVLIWREGPPSRQHGVFQWQWLIERLCTRDQYLFRGISLPLRRCRLAHSEERSARTTLTSRTT